MEVLCRVFTMGDITLRLLSQPHDGEHLILWKSCEGGIQWGDIPLHLLSQLHDR